MTKWNRVISGFDSEDETANFGTRNFAESNGSIYETWTLASIEADRENNDELTNENPNVAATIWYDRMCVAIDTSITIFEDQMCQNVLSSIGFDTPITTYCILTDISLLFVSVEDAMLHCFSLVDGGSKIFSIDFKKKYNCPRIIKICSHEIQNNTDVIVVTSIGHIYRINRIDQVLVNNGTFDYSQLAKNIDLVSINSLHSVQYVAEFNSTRCIDQSNNLDLPSMVIIGNELCILPSGLSCNLDEFPYEYKKIQFFNNYNAMICLRTDECLSIVCLKTLLGTKIWNGPVKDFVTIQEKSHDFKQMLVLMAPENNDTTTLLHLMSFPDFNIIFTMSVSSSTYLVDTIGDTVDHLLFLEGIKTSSNCLNEIRIKAIEEGIPDLRLQRFLRQKRFDEARAFANEYNLDIESVYQAEAVMFMNRFHPLSNNKDNIDLNAFKKILDKINDIQFVYECCNNILTSDYKDTRNLCEYVRLRIINNFDGKNKIDKNDISKLLQNVSDILRKLETFEMIKNDRLNNQIHENDNITEWNKFHKSDLLDEYIRYLSLSELNAATLIWIRHTPIFAKRLTKDIVINMLNVIPDNLQSSELWPWLRHFIPSLSSFLPNALAAIIQWACKKTKLFETFDRNSWPNNGIEFANGFINILQFDQYNVCFQLHQQYARKDSQFHQLTQLIQAMTDLLELKSHYKIVFPLNIYLGDPINVINLLLSKVHIDDVPELMRNFLQHYMLNNSLQNDEVLSKFIQNVLRNSKDWWLLEKAPWDKRLSVVIGFIHNIKIRLEQTLQVLKQAPVPWSEPLIQLAERSYVYDHPLVSEIRFESHCVAEKLILKKYGFAHTQQWLKLFHSIVKQNRATMIDDIFELTKTDSPLRMRILYFCINFHFNQGNIDNVINILQKLSDDNIVKCCEQLVHVMQSKLNFSVPPIDLLKNNIIFEVLDSFITRLRQSITSNSQYFERLTKLSEAILDFRNLSCLNTELNICVTMNSYIRNKKTIFFNYMKTFNEENNIDDSNLPNVVKKIERINNLLCLPKFFGLYHLLSMFKYSTALKLYISSYLGSKEMILKEESTYANKICLLLVENPEDDKKMFIHLQKVYSSSFICSDQRSLSDNLRLGRYIDAYSDAIGSCNDRNDPWSCSTMKNSTWKLYPIYRDVSVSSGRVLLPLLRDGFRILSYYYTNTQQCESTDSFNNEIAIESLSRSFLHRVSAIQNEHHDYSLLKIIMTIYFELCSLLPKSNKSVIEIQMAFDHCVHIVLRRVISSRVFDLQLGLVCLDLLPEAEKLKSLSTVAKFFQADFTRDQIVKDLGYEYCRITKRIDQMNTYKYQRVLHYWGQRLVNYGISYREVLQSDIEKKRDILRCVMTSNKPDTIELLRDFCEHFSFNIDDCYLSYLQTILCTWEPKYDISIENNSQNELKIDENDVKQLTSTCRKIAGQIKDKVTMKRYLIQMISQINFYHYELFIILLELSEEKSIETICHLMFLQTYRRVSTPTDIEHEEWAKFTQENESLPLIAKWRLPYLPKVDQYKLITPELNFKTYKKWLTIANVLNIPIHNICTLAVKGAVTEAWKIKYNDHENNTSKWSINLRNSALLDDIKECINYMTGPDGLHYGTAALYYVVNHTPPGADLVAAAKECYLYSQRWREQSNQPNMPENTKLTKIKEKYLKYSAKHVLHTHGLGQEKYLNLVENPEKLVQELYQDETIPNRYKSAISKRPDINSAVDALGTTFSLNLIKLRLELLNEWLQPWEHWNSKLNESITINFTQDLRSTLTNDSFAIDDNLIRACYIVDSGDTESFVNYLIGIGFPEDNRYCHDSGVRFRALQVLQSITNEETLRDYVKRDIQTVNQCMQTLQYMNELERLGLAFSVEGFETCSKHELVQLLIDTNNHSPRSLGLISQLYIDYKIDDYHVLSNALERMIQLSLVEDLKKTLLMLGTVDCIFNTDSYIAAWQVVITDSFNKLDYRPSAESIKSCVETLRILHACPVIDKLELSSIINCCVRAKQWHLAAAFLPFLNNCKDRELIIQELRQMEMLNEVTHKLLDLEVEGILIVRHAILILEQAHIIPPTNKLD